MTMPLRIADGTDSEAQRPATGADLAEQFVGLLQNMLLQRPDLASRQTHERYTYATGAFDSNRWEFAHQGSFLRPATVIGDGLLHDGDAVHAVHSPLSPEEQRNRQREMARRNAPPQEIGDAGEAAHEAPTQEQLLDRLRNAETLADLQQNFEALRRALLDAQQLNPGGLGLRQVDVGSEEIWNEDLIAVHVCHTRRERESRSGGAASESATVNIPTAVGGGSLPDIGEGQQLLRLAGPAGPRPRRTLLTVLPGVTPSPPANSAARILAAAQDLIRKVPTVATILNLVMFIAFGPLNWLLVMDHVSIAPRFYVLAVAGGALNLLVSCFGLLDVSYTAYVAS